jgi:hypothetical protein
VTISDEALRKLEELGGRLPWTPRTLQRKLKPLTPTQIRAAAIRDHQLRTSHGEAIGPVWELLVGRAELLQVARAYRNAVEAVEDPRGKPADAILHAATALQEMLRAMGAQGNSLHPLFLSARRLELLGPYDDKLADALDDLVDWVNADRAGRGSAHLVRAPDRQDAWLALRVVAALLLRLEALRVQQQSAR